MPQMSVYAQGVVPVTLQSTGLAHAGGGVKTVVSGPRFVRFDMTSEFGSLMRETDEKGSPGGWLVISRTSGVGDKMPLSLAAPTIQNIENTSGRLRDFVSIP